MASSRYSSLDDYLASLGPIKAKTMKAIIDFILGEFPGLECKLAWNVPQIHRQGEYVVGLSASKNHLTFAPWSQDVLQDFHGKLGKYVVLKNCFQIPVDWKIEKKLVKDMVRARLAELD